MDKQKRHFITQLESYQGKATRNDDVTVVGFAVKGEA